MRMVTARRAAGALMVTALATLGACGGDDDATEPTPTASGAVAPVSDAPTGSVTDETPAATTLAPTAQHFDSDLHPVCRGTGAEWATPYDPAAAGAHKVVLLEGESESDLSDRSTWLNQEWQVLFDTATDAYAEVSLVVCAIRTGAEKTETCTGYTDDDDPSFAGTVDVYVSTFAVTVRDATTAEVIAETELDAPESECPMFAMFDEGDPSSEEYLADYDALNEFLTEYATT
jgi:hypothetical protein